MKRVAALLILPLALLVATGQRPVALQAPAPLATIPFELATRHVIVKVTINNSRPLSFVLDTGAHLAVVRMPVAKELGLHLEGSVSMGGAGGGRQAGQRVKNARWSLVGLRGFSQPITLAVPFEGMSPGMGQDIDGIIGGEFIKEFVLELDYQAKQLMLHDPRSFSYRGKGETLPMQFNANNHPVMRATLTAIGAKPVEAPFTLDIGSGGALILHSPFVAEQGLPGDVKTIRAIGMAGAGGQSFGRIGRVASLQIGTYTLKDVTATFSEDQGGAFADRTLAGNIGAQIVRRFRVFFDYGRKRITLEPSSAFDEPFDGPMTGLAVRAFGADYRTFRVAEVLEDSPATEAGIRTGDVITELDGVPAAKWSLSELLETLQKTTPHKLTITRGGETISVTLTPRRLL